VVLLLPCPHPKTDLSVKFFECGLLLPCPHPKTDLSVKFLVDKKGAHKSLKVKSRWMWLAAILIEHVVVGDWKKNKNSEISKSRTKSNAEVIGQPPKDSCSSNS
jgi:hypothetical protein